MNGKGVLIVGHGSKSPDAIEEFDKVVDMLRQKLGGVKLLGAHMEINEPSIPNAIDALLLEGISEITVIPYFLFMGKHIKFDIPEILLKKKQLHPDLIINYSQPVGADPLIAEILSQRALDTFLKKI